MARVRVTLEELLLRHGAIDEAKLRRAREEQAKAGGDLGRILLDLGYVGEELLARTQAHQLGLPLVRPDQMTIPPDAVKMLSVHLCKKYGVVPVGGNPAGRLLRVATASPADAEKLASLAHETGLRIEFAVATPSSIDRATAAAYGEPAEEP